MLYTLIEVQAVLQVLETPYQLVKALYLTKKIDYFCFSFADFKDSVATEYA